DAALIQAGHLRRPVGAHALVDRLPDRVVSFGAGVVRILLDRADRVGEATQLVLVHRHFVAVVKIVGSSLQSPVEKSSTMSEGSLTPKATSKVVSRPLSRDVIGAPSSPASVSKISSPSVFPDCAVMYI